MISNCWVSMAGLRKCMDVMDAVLKPIRCAFVRCNDLAFYRCEDDGYTCIDHFGKCCTPLTEKATQVYDYAYKWKIIEKDEDGTR
jgi:hypothetical protein